MRFLIYSRSTNIATLKFRSRVNQGHWSGIIRHTEYGFLLVLHTNFVPKSLRYSTCNYTVTLKPGYGSLKVIGTDTYRAATYDFLLTFHGNHGSISYCFRDKRRFQSKLTNFSTPCILRPHWRGSFGIGYQRWVQKLEWWGYRVKKEVWRVDRIQQRDSRTDGHRATERRAVKSVGRPQRHIADVASSLNTAQRW